MPASDKTLTPPGDSTQDRKFLWSLVFLTLLLYLQTVGFGFVNYDDPIILTENPQVRAGLTAASVRWALTTNFIYWQPLVYLSHMAVVSAFGLDPAPHHLVNVLLHTVNVALVFIVFRRLRAPLWPAASAAAVFSVHPLRVESVAWVTERKDVLSAMFWLLTMWAYARYTGEPRDRRRYWLMFLFFALGLMAKPVLVTLPVCLLVLDYWPLRRWPSTTARELVLEKIPLFGLSVVVAAVTVLGQSSIGAVSTFADLPMSLRLANALRSYAMYIWITVWPAKLAVAYPYPDSFPLVELLASAVLVGAISYFAWTRRNTAPRWIAAWLWYLVTLAPSIGILQVGPTPYSDRFTYLPAILPLLVVALAVSEKVSATVFRAGGIAVTAILFCVAWAQTGVWRDDMTLYRHAIAVAPGASVVYTNLGVALEKQGKLKEAVANHEIAASLNEKDAVPFLNLGRAYLTVGRTADAVQVLTKAVALDPGTAAPRYHYTRALIEAGRLDEAAAQARRALPLAANPGMEASLHMQLGLISYIRKDDAGALAEFREALRLDPQYWPARKNIGIALGNLGRNAEAIAEFETYLASNPGDKDVAAAIAALRMAK